MTLIHAYIVLDIITVTTYDNKLSIDNYMYEKQSSHMYTCMSERLVEHKIMQSF